MGFGLGNNSGDSMLNYYEIKSRFAKWGKVSFIFYRDIKFPVATAKYIQEEVLTLCFPNGNYISIL